MSAISKCYPAILSNHFSAFLHVAAYVEDLVEPCFMIFRFLFESDEALQASVSNRIIIYLLTDSTLTPAHDDPSPSQQQPAHLLPYIDTRCCWLLMLSEESIVPSTSSLLALHGTTDTLLFLFETIKVFGTKDFLDYVYSADSNKQLTNDK